MYKSIYTHIFLLMFFFFYFQGTVKLMGGRKPMLMSYQFSLPKLSVPSIHDTMNRVCMQHLLTESEFLNLLSV